MPNPIQFINHTAEFYEASHTSPSDKPTPNKRTYAEISTDYYSTTPSQHVSEIRAANFQQLSAKQAAKPITPPNKKPKKNPAPQAPAQLSKNKPESELNLHMKRVLDSANAFIENHTTLDETLLDKALNSTEMRKVNKGEKHPHSVYKQAVLRTFVQCLLQNGHRSEKIQSTLLNNKKNPIQILIELYDESFRSKIELTVAKLKTESKRIFSWKDFTTGAYGLNYMALLVVHGQLIARGFSLEQLVICAKCNASYKSLMALCHPKMPTLGFSPKQLALVCSQDSNANGLVHVFEYQSNYLQEREELKEEGWSEQEITQELKPLWLEPEEQIEMLWRHGNGEHLTVGHKYLEDRAKLKTLFQKAGRLEEQLETTLDKVMFQRQQVIQILSKGVGCTNLPRGIKYLQNWELSQDPNQPKALININNQLIRLSTDEVFKLTAASTIKENKVEIGDNYLLTLLNKRKALAFEVGMTEEKLETTLEETSFNKTQMVHLLDRSQVRSEMLEAGQKNLDIRYQLKNQLIAMGLSEIQAREKMANFNISKDSIIAKLIRDNKSRNMIFSLTDKMKMILKDLQQYNPAAIAYLQHSQPFV